MGFVSKISSLKNTKAPATETITFRINKRVLEAIKEISNQGGISVNTLINQILNKAVMWDIAATQSGWVPIPKQTLVSIMDQIDDKNIIEIAHKNGKIIPKDILYIMKGNIEIRNWIDVLKYRAIAAGFKYSEYEENNYFKFVTQHDMGMKWSNYFSAYYDTAFKELGGSAKITATENTVIYQIDKKYL